MLDVGAPRHETTCRDRTEDALTIETRARVEPRDHAVLFYESDDELVETVVRHLVDGLGKGERAVVVATAAHIEAFEAALARTAIDMAGARASGLWLTFDASDALSRFLVGDRPDPDAFAAEMGDLIRRVADSGHSIRLYGEMVALLWDAGQVAAAIELEDLWNELGQTVPFSLLCAYPVTSVTHQDDEDSFHRLCHCHSTVVGDMPTRAPVVDPGGSGGTEATRSFACDSSELSAARRFVGGRLVAWNLEQYAADASIVVSELATNAIGHARSGFVVALSSHDGALRISVRDASRELPVVRDPSPTTMTGRGLVLVAAIARSWGMERVADGKVVWAELSA
jgi:anti-sigma regulatory factor (Ser/Thr protein kinase)